MNIRRFYLGKAVGFIVVVIFISGYFLFSNYLGQEKQVEDIVIEPQACTEEAKLCPDGSSVVRSGPECAFDACPSFEPTTDKVSVALGGSTMVMGVTISPQEVISDSRCPIDAQCVWAGTVEVRTVLATQVAHGEHVLRLGDPQVFGDYSVTLVEVLPAKAQTAISDASYQFIYKVSLN